MPDPALPPGTNPPHTLSTLNSYGERVDELARDLAADLQPSSHRNRDYPLPAWLRLLEETIREAYRHFEQASRARSVVTQAAEWLLDNFYVIEQAFNQVGEAMPAEFYKLVPRARFGGGSDMPRVYLLASALTRAAGGRLEVERLETFVHAFQETAPLTIGEIWALPVMLRLTALETLAEALADITQRPFGRECRYFVPWPDEETGGSDPQPGFADEAVIASILSLRLLATQDWKAFFEDVSLVEDLLREDPAGIYARMDFETRNRYRNEVEELGAGRAEDELRVARTILELARQGRSPHEQTIGHYLVGEGRVDLENLLEYRPPAGKRLRHWSRRRAFPFYLGSILVPTAGLVLAVAGYGLYAGGNPVQVLTGVLLAAIPISAAVVDIVHRLIVRSVPPHTLPKLDFEQGIPDDCAAMVVIPALLSGEADVPSLLRQIETQYLGNDDPNIHFALLTDFTDAPEQETPGDERLVEQAAEGIRRLNEQYGSEDYGPFLLFHRRRLWNPHEECWMGWERKRGKLEEFNRLLRGDIGTSYTVQVGDLDILPAVRYVITLDEDTLLPHGSAQRLIGTMAHPLNRAQVDPVTGVLASGYSILQPRVQVRPAAANRSLFTRVYSGDSTLDLYTRAVSDVYMDLFGEGNFVGKGIYDVDAFERSLRNRVPENTLLSHDLFEGIHGRCGLVTDVVLYEGYPPHYLALTQRMHRWVRGDWQLLPWLGRKAPSRTGGSAPNDLSALDRWKIVDNLRRSLLPPAVLMLLAAGWMFLPGAEAVWTVLALAGYLPGIVFSLLEGLGRSKSPDGPRGDVRPLRQALLRPLFEVIFLPHESLLISDAILTTLARLAFTRKRLLQWVTAAHTVRVFGKRMRLAVVWREMIISPLFSLALLAANLAWFPSPSLFSMSLLLGWMLSPAIAMYISRPAYRAPEPLPQPQQRLLRRLARATWLYFEHFVGPDDHWLPPDHFQEDPRGLVAHRTSPTNIGLLLLSTFSAYDLGYIGPQELAVRLRNTLDGMEQLECHRGHFLNWYDTRSLAPLSPRYVSTVDSGNLAASLMTVRQGCRDAAARPVVRWEGLVDTLDVLLSALEEMHLGGDAGELKQAILQLRDRAQGLSETRQCSPDLLVSLFSESRLEIETLLANLVESTKERFELSTLRKLSTWTERSRHHLASLQRDIERLCPWSLALATAPVFFGQTGDDGSPLGAAWDELKDAFSFGPILKDIPAICRLALERLHRLEGLVPGDEAGAREWCRSLEAGLQSALLAAEELLDDLQAISSDADACVEAMDFRFLFDSRRQVFHIGYNAESGNLDPNFYDLLASEARIASLLAIGKGDVPSSHWLYLARPLTQFAGTRLLLSWSGTMFEYLMPVLFMRNYPNTLLDQSCRAATDRQISYGHEKGTPWGISESSYYHFDASQIYQYRAFGVPGLGYKRGLGDDLVIAPYASVLALPFAARAVVQNIGRFQKMKACGLYGLYEAVDFTSARLAAGQEYAVVRTYMAHHQGMILLSLSNYLLDGLAVRRFHADARVESVEFLLQEQTPQGASVEYPHPQKIGLVHPIHLPVSLDGWRAARASRHPQVHSLTNGSYSLLITSSGAGYSRWRETDLTRWRADSTLDPWGVWLYVQDRENGRLWSAAAQPTGASSDHREVRFFPHKVEFERRDDDISLHMRLAVAPEDDVEMRQVAVANHSDRRRRISLTSYGEVILASQDVDQRHPAFNRLFIESEYLEAEKALLFRRRPRSQDEQAVYLAHFVVSDPPGLAVTGSETDRLRFLGRGGTPRLPAALQPGTGMLSGSTGATLDPIFSLQVELSLGPYESASLAFVTVAAASRKEALDLIDRYSQWSQLERGVAGAAEEAAQEMERLELTSPQVERFEKLLSVLLYPSPALRADPATLSANSLGQSGLWPFAISGDHPILLARLADGGLDLLRDLLQAHTYWRRRGLKIDLVILNQRETGYEQDLGNRIHRLLTQTGNDGWLNKRGGIFILREDQMSGPERILLASAARAVLDGEAGSLEQQLRELDRRPARLPRFVPVQPPAPPLDPAVVVERPGDLLFDNGLGGFTPDGREYVIYLNPGQQTPAPWINVIANPGFGFLVSESGMGCTWAQNSGENRLTPWHNDPVSDPPAEAVYLRDEDTGQVWSPTPLPARADAPYLVRHGAGYSTFEHGSHGLAQHLTLFAVPDSPLKIVQLKLENKTDRTRRINVTYYTEWVLGDQRENTAPHLVPEFDSRLSALLVRNPYHPEFGGSVAFLAATRELNWVTTDRTEFLGARGHYARPAALGRLGLTGSVQAGSDPCAVMQNLIWLAPGETKEISYLLGQGADRDSALDLIRRFQDVSTVEAAWMSVSQSWDELLGAVQVHTPDPALDLLVNRWLLYQSLVCRIWGRTAFYQSGGAFGFRDQLQDVLALLHTRPALAREHILRAAACQFEEGDVLHWWHPPGRRGIRTRIADNLIWLPYVTARYVQATGDRSILDEQIPFLQAPLLGEGEHERYGHFQAGGQSGSLYEHCRRALHKGATKSSRGLPLIGAGDWNDGMNLVGIGGSGESIWLGWFLIAALNDFAELCDLRGDGEEAAACREKAEAYRLAIENHGWDGNWYRRAYFDNGAPLGSKENSECRIDSISQSWAVISGAANPERARKAMQALDEKLIRRREGLLLLLTPPFDRSLNDPGYIKGYAPGVRENGGQYTHAALWAVWAFAELGDGDRAAELFGLLNPIRHADGPGKTETYRVEPYAVAADVYGAPPHVGRGGWTWYTGSASWMYRLGVERLLGLRRRGEALRVDPCIPRHWPGFEVVYRFGGAQYRIQVENPQGLNRGIGQAFLDGKPLPAAEVPLVDDGREHVVRLVLGGGNVVED